jgi:BirA family biotin operon repressor/biotin-[acetyl-CoA-carboxylase] ligase
MRFAMIAITDDTSFAEGILGDPARWSRVKAGDLSRRISTLGQSIFGDNAVYQAFYSNIPQWDSLLAVKYSSRSHFDMLTDFCRRGISLPDGILCLAGSGAGFHGFHSRPWVALPGNIHLVAHFAPDRPIPRFGAGFIILAAVSVLQVVDSIGNLTGRAGIKWVNDILVDNAKIGGVLAYTQAEGDKVTGAVLGIGLNVETTPAIEPSEFVPAAVSLLDLSGDPGQCNQTVVLNHLIHYLHKNYVHLYTGGYAELLRTYIERSVIIGREVAVYPDAQVGSGEPIAAGKVAGIGNDLELYLEGHRPAISKGRLVLKR